MNSPRTAGPLSARSPTRTKRVTALGHLAGNLALAVGADPGPGTGTARDLGFAALDGPYRHWLSRLGDSPDPVRSRGDWQVVVSEIVRGLGRQLLDSAGPAAGEGRYVEMRAGGTRLIDDAQADLWFRKRLNAVLPEAAIRRAAEGGPTTDSPDGEAAKTQRQRRQPRQRRHGGIGMTMTTSPPDRSAQGRPARGPVGRRR